MLLTKGLSLCVQEGGVLLHSAGLKVYLLVGERGSFPVRHHSISTVSNTVVKIYY